MDRNSGDIRAEHCSRSQSPARPGREMPPPPPTLIWFLVPVKVVLLTLLPIATASTLPFSSGTNEFPAGSWPRISFAGFDYFHDYSEFANPDDEHLLSSSAAYASILPLGMSYNDDPYGLAVSESEQDHHGNMYFTFDNKRTQADQGALTSLHSLAGDPNAEHPPFGLKGRLPNVAQGAKPVHGRGVLPSPKIKPPQKNYQHSHLPRKTPNVSQARLKSEGQRLKSSEKSYAIQNAEKGRLRIPQTIKRLPFPREHLPSLKTRRPSVFAPTTLKRSEVPAQRYGQRKQRRRKLRTKRPQALPRVQESPELGGNASESKVVLNRKQRDSGEELDKDFMPSQYVIDLKFHKSSNGRPPNSMGSKGFTETHHRLLERFEEIHQHGDNNQDVGQSDWREHYDNSGYHDSHDVMDIASVRKSAKTGYVGESKDHRKQLYTDASSPKVVEVAVPVPLGVRRLNDRTVPLMTLGKPPIKVRTLLDGTGSSRGPPTTIAYRGPHSPHVHPPIPSKDFRVTDDFRRWATSSVHW